MGNMYVPFLMSLYNLLIVIGIEEKWQELSYNEEVLRDDFIFQDALGQDVQSGAVICLTLHKDFIKERFLPKVPKIRLHGKEVCTCL